MRQFVAFGIAVLFALAINVADLDAQCCGSSAPVAYSGQAYSAAPAYNSYGWSGNNGCCNSGCNQQRTRWVGRRRARRNCCAPTTNCCSNNNYAQVAYAAPVSNCGGCNTGCNTGCGSYASTGCGNRCGNRCGNTGCGSSMYTSTVSGCGGCNTGCGNGCGQVMNSTGCSGCGGQVMTSNGGCAGCGSMQGTVIEGGVIEGGVVAPAEGQTITPPTPDDT